MTWRLTVASSALLFLAGSGNASTLYVSQSGDGSDGLSWPTAYTAIGDALAVSASGDEIWVATGTYNESIQMVTGVALFGGFLGSETPNQFNLRDWDVNGTIIDAEGLRATGVLGADEAILDGFSIINASTEIDGGGLRLIGIEMTLCNCNISENRVSRVVHEMGCIFIPHVGSYCWDDYVEYGLGGGILADGASISFFRCSISDNRAPDGGGILIRNDSSIEIIECDITGNRADDGGGMELRSGGSVEISRSIVSDNYSRSGGGGIDAYGAGSLIIRESIISQNTSDTRLGNGAGGIYGFVHNYPIIIHQCYVYDNRTTDIPNLANYATAGGAAFTSPARVTNSVFSGNVVYPGANRDYAAGALSSKQSCYIDNCIFYNNSGPTGAILCDPTNRKDLFVLNSIIYDNNDNDSGVNSPEDAFAVVPRGPTKICNSIVQNHMMREIYTGYGPEVTYSNIRGGFAGEGNIDRDPRFVDPSRGDFRLLSDSPSIDSGTANGVLADIDGYPRPVDIIGVGRDGPGAYDMGPYEFHHFDEYRADFDGNLGVDFLDLFKFGPAWHQETDFSEDPRNINGDDAINALDLLTLIHDWQLVTGAM